MKTKINHKIIFLTKKVSVDSSKILFVEGDINYSKIYLECDLPIYVATTLKNIELSLSSLGFLRIHKKYLINCEALKRSTFENFTIVLENNHRIKVSRRKYSEVKNNFFFI